GLSDVAPTSIWEIRMKWNPFAPSVHPWTRRLSASGLRYRPTLDTLEDRTLLSQVVFTELQSQSPLALSGTIAGKDMQQQGTGSLTTTYFGTFLADIDLSKGTIIFIGTGNDFCAADTGSWAPLPDGSNGTAPAIYGVQVDIRGQAFMGAIRDYHMEA